MIKDLIGWDLTRNETSDNIGIFGKAIGFGLSTEEQNRTTLHGHMMVHLVGFNTLRRSLYSTDHTIQSKSRLLLESYVSQVMGASFLGLEFSKHTTPNGDICTSKDPQITGIPHQDTNKGKPKG